MIIDNVKVYTEEKTFVKGGIMLDGDKIQRSIYRRGKPQLVRKRYWTVKVHMQFRA